MISVKYEFTPLSMEKVENLALESEVAKPSTTSNKDKSELISKCPQKDDAKVKIKYDDPEYEEQWRFSKLSEKSPIIETSSEEEQNSQNTE